MFVERADGSRGQVQFVETAGFNVKYAFFLHIWVKLALCFDV